MKYFSLALLFAVMIWSWKFAYNEAPLGEYTHLSLQEELKRNFQNYIQKKIPSARSIHFEKIWTENLKKNQVKAYFTYSFEDDGPPPGKTTMQGFALLNKKSTGLNNWRMSDLVFSNNRLDFQEGLEIISEEK